MKVEEPIIAYNTQSMQRLKNRLIKAVDCSCDEERLYQCLELLESSHSPIPCVFTEEEFDEEIRISEAGGCASDEDIASVYNRVF